MLTKFVFFLLFCEALINAKTLVQRQPYLSASGGEKIKQETVDSFPDLFQELENDEVQPTEYKQVDQNPQMHRESDSHPAGLIARDEIIEAPIPTTPTTPTGPTDPTTPTTPTGPTNPIPPELNAGDGIFAVTAPAPVTIPPRPTRFYKN